MGREIWLQTLLKRKVPVATAMAAETSKERKVIVNKFILRNYVTTEKNKIQKTTKRPPEG